MLTRPLISLVACAFLVLGVVGCKERVALLIVDSNTGEPVAHALIDHRAQYSYTDARSGQFYLKSTTPTDEHGYLEIEEFQRVDRYIIRAPGYARREARLPKPGEEAEYMVVGGANVTEWVEADEVPSDERQDDDVPTFIIPVDPS